MAESTVWDTIGPPVGSVYNDPARKRHGAVSHLAQMPTPAEIAVLIDNRGTGPTMLARLKAGESIGQVPTWANREREGFV